MLYQYAIMLLNTILSAMFCFQQITLGTILFLDPIFYDGPFYDDGPVFAMAAPDSVPEVANAVPQTPSITPRSFFPETWLFDNLLAGYILR